MLGGGSDPPQRLHHMLGGGSRPPQRLHHMLGGGWGVSRRAPPSLEAMSACSLLVKFFSGFCEDDGFTTFANSLERRSSLFGAL